MEPEVGFRGALGVHRRYSPYTAFSLASLPHRIFEYGLVARLTAALSTGNLDDATGSIDDIPLGLRGVGRPPAILSGREAETEKPKE